ncbi:MAG: UbiX family flavin prenyltransferase [Rhodoferax sp.]|nr:UbiX family flavin prenyltransferase [Rhodoferax sp.]
MKRVLVAISGASGAVYGVRLLHYLKQLTKVNQGLEVDFAFSSDAGSQTANANTHRQLQTHLVVSAAGWRTLAHELHITREQVEALADMVYPVEDIGAAVASGSFGIDAMVVAPCSMRTLAGVALGLSDNLITRAADVMLKERRRLILMVRETPLNLAHLRHMVSVTEMGGIIFPPVPAFYQQPTSLDEMVNHTVQRVLDLLGLPVPDAPRWAGLPDPIDSPKSA